MLTQDDILDESIKLIASSCEGREYLKKIIEDAEDCTLYNQQMRFNSQKDIMQELYNKQEGIKDGNKQTNKQVKNSQKSKPGQKSNYKVCDPSWSSTRKKQPKYKIC